MIDVSQDLQLVDKTIHFVLIIFYIILTEHLRCESPAVLQADDLVDRCETASAQGSNRLVETVETCLVDGLAQLTDPHLREALVLDLERDGLAEVVHQLKSFEFPLVETLHYGSLYLRHEYSLKFHGKVENDVTERLHPAFLVRVDHDEIIDQHKFTCLLPIFRYFSLGLHHDFRVLDVLEHL